MLRSSFSLFTMKRASWLIAIGVIVTIAILPLVTANRYYLQIVISILLSAALASAVTPLIKLGLLFVAQGAFLAIGAYTTGILVTRAAMNGWAAMAIAVAITAVAAVVLGFPTLRVKGLYFLLVTFGLNEAVRIGVSNWDFVGGVNGIINIRRLQPIPVPGGGQIDFTNMVHYYYLLLILAFLVIIFFYRLWKSHLGRLIRAINSSEELAQGVGVNLFRYRLLIFVLSCSAAGLIGSFQAFYYGLVVPSQFAIWTSFNPIIYGIVGGLGSPVGPIVGSVFLVALPEFVRFLLEFRPLVYAGALILVMLFFPRGIMGLVDRLNLRLRENNGKEKAQA